jgi:hypothetical protein
MTTARTGVEAIGAAAAGALADRAEEQLELMPPSRFEPGTPEHDRVVASVRRGQRGRPPGARNRATQAAADLVRRLFGDPLVIGARWLLHTPESLALELGCSKLEAFDRLERLRADLCRYVHAPRAAEDGRGEAIPPTFTIAIGDQVIGGEGSPAPWAYLDELEEKQRLASPGNGVSAARLSDRNGK